MTRSPILPPTPMPPSYKPVDKHQDAAGWDAYLQRRVESFAKLPELSHYMLALGYIFQRDPDAVSILDLGCGDGALFDLISHQMQRTKRYVGLDLSAWGVEQAQKRWPLANVEFQAVDIYTWEPKDNERFDRIVFCESLQYIEKPTELLQRYARYLSDDGYIVASVFELENRRTADFWRDAEPHFECLDAVTMRNDLIGLTWNVRMIRPR